MKKCIAMAVFTCFLLTNMSCATVIRGTSHKFPIKSDIPAKVKFIGLKDGVSMEVQTPSTVLLKRKQGYKVIVAAEGFDPQEFEITSKGDWGWLIIGDLVIAGGILGIIIDVANGSYRTLNPKELNLQFNNTSADINAYTPDSIIEIEPNKRYLISLNAQ